MERLIHVAILDSGIDKQHKTLHDVNITEYAYIGQSEGWQVTQDKPKNGHGTAVAHILHRYEKNIKITSFKIIEETNGEAELDKLIDALYYIYTHNDVLHCQVINISAGVRKHHPELEKICMLLSFKGVLIVSAFCNMGAVSYPAAYSCVIGVDSTNLLNRFHEYIYVENSLVNIGLLAAPQRVAWTDPEYTIVRGNSFVTPILTARICSMLYDGLDYTKIWNYLKENAAKVISFCDNKTDYKTDMFCIHKAAVFPFNKETQSLLRFSHLLPFDIERVYDSRFSGRVGKKVSNLHKNIDITIQNFDEISFEGIDTFIIGHIGELSRKSGVNYKQLIVDNCLNNNINIVSFDTDYIEALPAKTKEQIYVPVIQQTKQSSNKFGKLYEIYSPVLAVVGTSSQQGKFSLQLKLRELFLQNEYTIRQLSSEPEGILFGMNAVYPYGYDGTVNLKGHYSIEYVNYLMHEMDIDEPDIIILGAQSGVATLSFDNLSTYNIASMDFLLGANPDAAILCVNFYDSIEMIKRSIHFVESLSDCKVIAIEVFPLGFSDEWSAMSMIKKEIPQPLLKSFCNMVMKETGRPAYILGNESEDCRLFQDCIRFFSE